MVIIRDIIRDRNDMPIQQIVVGANGQLERRDMATGALIDWVEIPRSKRPDRQVLPDCILNAHLRVHRGYRHARR